MNVSDKVYLVRYEYDSQQPWASYWYGDRKRALERYRELKKARYNRIQLLEGDIDTEIDTFDLLLDYSVNRPEVSYL